jgi:hypothetical protein
MLIDSSLIVLDLPLQCVIDRITRASFSNKAFSLSAAEKLFRVSYLNLQLALMCNIKCNFLLLQR